jgi:hypothetical protein
VREVKKKVLGIALVLLFVAMLATPIIGTVMAGKGQEKLDFLLHMEGTTVPPPEKGWVTKGGIQHTHNLAWEVRENFYIEIGEAGAVETIPKEELSYSGLLVVTMVNTKQGWFLTQVRETITIYTDDSQTAERGTIEILTLGTNPAGNGAVVNGFGTGEFEGVKIMGRTTASMMTNPSPPPDNLLVLDRLGTVMGWPT